MTTTSCPHERRAVPRLAAIVIPVLGTPATRPTPQLLTPSVARAASRAAVPRATSGPAFTYDVERGAIGSL